MTTSLRRYINIPALVYLFSEKKLSLLNPKNWDDRNDSHYLELYARAQRFKSVRAACFARAPETYHHWRVFTDGESGACVVFNGETLFEAVDAHVGIRRSEVEYLTLSKLEKADLKAKDLPFRKRKAFEPESEYRVIFQSKTLVPDVFDVEIPMSSIDRVIINPWLPEVMFTHLKAALTNISGCKRVKIIRSSLISNDQWQHYGNKILEKLTFVTNPNLPSEYQDKPRRRRRRRTRKKRS